MVDKSARDGWIAQVAARQHGLISSGQLHTAGLTNAAVAKRCRVGRLHRVHRGVYAVGHRPATWEARWLAAVLALADASLSSGRGGSSSGGTLASESSAHGQHPAAARAAALSHRSAAALWRLLPPQDGPVEVSVPGDGGRRRRQGIRIHRCLSLRPSHTTRHRGIPVTTPSRTIADLRGAVSARERRQAIRQAEVLGLATGPDATPDRTRSELEFEFLRLCERHRLPKPDVNVRIGPLLVDFLWAEARYVVETDGWRYHRGKAAFEDDHSRDLELRTRGYEVARFSYRQVIDEPVKVARGLRTALERRGLAP